MENYTKEQIEAIEKAFDRLVMEGGYDDDYEVSTIDDKYETIWQYYDAAGFEMNESNFWGFVEYLNSDCEN